MLQVFRVLSSSEWYGVQRDEKADKGPAKMNITYIWHKVPGGNRWLRDPIVLIGTSNGIDWYIQ